MFFLRPMLAALLLGSLPGCSLFFDLDSVPLRDAGAAAPDADVGQDAGPPGDDGGDQKDVSLDVADMQSDVADTGTDALDMRDVGRDVADLPVDLGPTGQPCPGDHPELPGDCNLVTQEPCGEDAVCAVVLVEGEPTRQCRQRAADETYDIAAGQPCEPGATVHCQPHLFCRSSVCVKYCNLQNGFGCDPDEFCASHEPVGLFAGLGYCADTCQQ